MTEDEINRQNAELLRESESFLELLGQKAEMSAETRVALNQTLAGIKKQRKNQTL